MKTTAFNDYEAKIKTVKERKFYKSKTYAKIMIDNNQIVN